LDDAVEHRDERRALPVQRLRHLREADASDVRERVEEPPQWEPPQRGWWACQRGIGSDRAQRSLNTAPPLEDRRNLGRGAPGAAAIGQREVRFGKRERPGSLGGVVRPLFKKAEQGCQRVGDDNVVPKYDRPARSHLDTVGARAKPDAAAKA